MKTYTIYQWEIVNHTYNKKEIGEINAPNKAKAIEKARKFWTLPHLYVKAQKAMSDNENRKYENIIVSVIHLTDAGDFSGFELDKLKGQNLIKGQTIEQLLKIVENQKQTGIIILYMHNLKYYAPYILANFEIRGFENKKSGGLKTFRTLTTGQNVYYAIDYETVNQKGMRVKVEIRDSNKKLPLSYEQIRQALKLPDISDIEALRLALLNQYRQGMNHLTLASDSMASWVDIMGGYNVVGQILGNLTREQDAYMRKGYSGGFLYCKAGAYKHGYSLDYNSAYSYAMKYELLPYGEPVYFRGRYTQNDNYPLYFQKIIVDCELKPGKIPAVRDDSGQFLIDTDIPKELTLTSVDLQLLYDYYDIYAIKYVDGYMMMGCVGLFSEFVDKYYTMKKYGETAGEILTAKLILNMLYGKFGTIPHRVNKEMITVNGELKTQNISEQEIEPRRVDMAAFITANVRKRTIQTAQRLNDLGILIYSDTDSVHFESETIPEQLLDELSNTELGKLKIEAEFETAKMIAPKCYAEFIKGKGWNAKVSGLHAHSCEDLESLHNFSDIFKPGAIVKNETLKIVNGKTLKVQGTYTIGGLSYEI